MTRPDPTSDTPIPIDGGIVDAPPARQTQPDVIVDDRWLARFMWLSLLLAPWIMLYPFDLSARPAPWLRDPMFSRIDLAANFTLFMPWALLAGLRMRRHGKPVILTLLAILLPTIAISLTAETLQRWMPDRHSSILDLAANTSGALLAGVFALAASRRANLQYDRLAAWLWRRPASRRALWVMAFAAVVKLAPFDLSPAIFYLRRTVRRTLDAGYPFERIITAWRAPGDWWRDAAAAEQAGFAAVGLLLFGLCGWALTLAVREARRKAGRRSGVVIRAVPLTIGLVMTLEVGQAFVRSRVMDGTEAAASLVGAVLGVLLAATLTSRRSIAGEPSASGRR